MDGQGEAIAKYITKEISEKIKMLEAQSLFIKIQSEQDKILNDVFRNIKDGKK